MVYFLEKLFRNKEAHKAISTFNAEMLQVQQETKKLVKHSEDTLDTARSIRGYKMAMAHGVKGRKF